jgi:short-subunit dehydrogenase
MKSQPASTEDASPAAGPGPARWTASDIPPQDGRLAIVTGTGGLGYETALALAQAGAEVILAGRNPAKGRDSVEKIMALQSGARIRFEPLDLARLASVAEFADCRLEGGKVAESLGTDWSRE